MQRDAAIARMEPVGPPVAPTIQTPELHQATRAVMVPCTSPVWHDGSSNTSSFSVPFSSVASSSSNVAKFPELHRGCSNPFDTVSSSATPQGLHQHASMALDTRSYGEERHAGSALQHKTSAPLDAPSCVDILTKGRVVNGVPLTCPSLAWRDTPSFDFSFSSVASSSLNVRSSPVLHRDCTSTLEESPPGERSCVEAVMEYLALGCPISEADVESMVADDD